MSESFGHPAARLPWPALLASWLVLFGPTYWDLADTIWNTEDQAHGAMILLIVLWLLWDRRGILKALPAEPRNVGGGILLACGLLLYVVGRSQEILVFEVGSQIPILAGALLVLQGWAALRILWFPILFIAFMVPLPGALVDAMTGPLKQWVSVIAENMLYAMGYPIARSGVVLTIGQYQLLVADACSGLNSIFSLSMLGLLYMYWMARRSWIHNGILLSSILPIAFAANLARVVILVLITFYLGDEAGQGFLHGTAGIVLLVTAVMLIIVLDALLNVLFRHDDEISLTEAFDKTRRAEVNEAATHAAHPKRGAGATMGFDGRSLAIGLVVLTAAASAIVLKPKPVPLGERPDLETLIPKRFDGWTIDPSVVPLLPSPDQQQQLQETYDQLVNRTYVNSSGKRIMISIAYGSRQDQKLKAHRQEVCYAAQGFQIRNLRHRVVRVSGADIMATQLFAVAKQRDEPVTYWFTVGNQVVQSHLQRFAAQLRYGLSGTIPDGVLVRISSIDRDEEGAYRDQLAFINEMFHVMPAEARVRFLGDTVK